MLWLRRCMKDNDENDLPGKKIVSSQMLTSVEQVEEKRQRKMSTDNKYIIICMHCAYCFAIVYDIFST